MATVGHHVNSLHVKQQQHAATNPHPHHHHQQHNNNQQHHNHQDSPHHSNLGLYYEARNRTSPYATYRGASGGATYFEAPTADVCQLPTLRETPSEHDSSGNSGVFDYVNDFEDEAYRYYVTNGHVPHLPLANSTHEVFTYYSPHQNGSEASCYSGDEELESFGRPSPRSNPRYHTHSSASESSSVSRMGSAGSAMPPPSKKSQKSSSSSRHRRCSDSSDNGGFPTTSSPASVQSAGKSHSMGMKEKLRASLDKISLKPAFRWNSADKLSVLSTSSKSSKSKNNSKTARRYSDSGTAFANAIIPNSMKESQKQQHQGSNPALSTLSTSRNHRDTPPSNSDVTHTKMVVPAKSRLVKANNYVSQRTVERTYTTDQTVPQSPSHSKRQTTNDYVNVVPNSRGGKRPNNLGNDTYLSQNGSYYDLNSPHGKEALSRAKGTWNMLRAAKTTPRQVPVKVPATASMTSSASSDTLQSSSTLKTASNNNSGDDVMSEFVTPTHHVVMPPPPIDVASSKELTPSEPPKLAPVSGKLILNENVQSQIVRPTAFKPVVQRHAASPQSSNVLSASEVIMTINNKSGGSQQHIDVSSCSVDSNSDSGRNSCTSIPVASTVGGCNVSCSNSSEGYESARVSSSTNHSNETTEINCAGSSPQVSTMIRHVSDDVMIDDLEARVRERENELQLMRRSFEDNEKALHRVYEDRQSAREMEIYELKQKYSAQLKTQNQRALKLHHKLQVQIQRLTEEKQIMLETNKHLEGQVKTMNDSLHTQARHDDVIDELRARLEECECDLQQNRGEISHLKRQIKDLQGECSQRAAENITLRRKNRELSARLTERENQLDELGAKLQLHERNEQGNSSPSSSTSFDQNALLQRLKAAEERCAAQDKAFEEERKQWIEDKSRVIRYQKQLQDNYVTMYKRSRDLEQQVKSLTSQLDDFQVCPGDTNPVKNDEKLCYPMEI